MAATHTTSRSEGGKWYHTIELPAGPTAGEYDLRSSVDKLPLPPSMSGKRCLDVGTHDGFWAFEMERRGAYEVVGIDIEDPEEIDWPEPRPTLSEDLRRHLAERKQMFSVAREALSSTVQHRYLSVYDLDVDQTGEFDFVHIGSLLHHLRDPVGALMAIRRVTRGELLVSAVFSISKTLFYPDVPLTVLSKLPDAPFWQVPNVAGLRRQIESAGFQVVRTGSPHLQRRGRGHVPTPTPRPYRNLRMLPSALLYRRGVPHIGILARPVGRQH